VVTTSVAVVSTTIVDPIGGHGTGANKYITSVIYVTSRRTKLTRSWGVNYFTVWGKISCLMFAYPRVRLDKSKGVRTRPAPAACPHPTIFIYVGRCLSRLQRPVSKPSWRWWERLLCAVMLELTLMFKPPMWLWSPQCALDDTSFRR
jgi:hypothetical protein